MTKKDLADMIEAEEKRLGLHSPEFMQRHREIMETADRIRRENKKQETMTLETLQQYVQTLTNEKVEHIIRQLCAVIYRYLEKRGQLPEQKEGLCQTGPLTKAGNP